MLAFIAALTFMIATSRMGKLSLMGAGIAWGTRLSWLGSSWIYALAGLIIGIICLMLGLRN